jgi:hypothetical protein
MVLRGHSWLSCLKLNPKASGNYKLYRQKVQQDCLQQSPNLSNIIMTTGKDIGKICKDQPNHADVLADGLDGYKRSSFSGHSQVMNKERFVTMIFFVTFEWAH